MRESNSHAINAIKNLLTKGASRNIECQYIRESNTHAINVIQNSVGRITSRNIKCHYMRESNTLVINVTLQASKELDENKLPLTDIEQKIQD